MNGVSGFPRLFEATRIGRMELRNCVVMPPMGTNMATVDGSVTDEIRAY
ncbi:MAG: hypothetical protein NTU41_13335 [Chloroflexi bacterium]|nr:hypothetical protein [Chloroflexota bacterium]